MRALNLIRHAVKMLCYDGWATVRLTLLPVFFASCVSFGGAHLFLDGGDFANLANSQSGPVWSESRTLLLLVAGLSFSITTIVFSWAAVGWHRFVLLGENPGRLLANINKTYVMSYIWAGFRVFGGILVMLIPLMILALSFNLSGNTVAIVVIPNIVMFILVVLVLRISLVLPAVAVGRRMSLRQSWTATKGYFSVLIGVSLTIILLDFLANLFSGYVGDASLVFVLNLLFGWLQFAFGLSILTTLYGVCVDKRTL